MAHDIIIHTRLGKIFLGSRTKLLGIRVQIVFWSFLWFGETRCKLMNAISLIRPNNMLTIQLDVPLLNVTWVIAFWGHFSIIVIVKCKPQIRLRKADFFFLYILSYNHKFLHSNSCQPSARAVSNHFHSLKK